MDISEYGKGKTLYTRATTIIDQSSQEYQFAIKRTREYK